MNRAALLHKRVVDQPSLKSESWPPDGSSEKLKQERAAILRGIQAISPVKPVADKNTRWS